MRRLALFIVASAACFAQKAVLFTGQPGAIPVTVGSISGTGCVPTAGPNQILVAGASTGTCQPATPTISGSTITGSLSGNATTSTALASNPTEVGCSATTPTTVTAIDASANLTCTSIQVATDSVPGVLSAADHTTFNGKAPPDATYITQTPNGTLSAEQALSALATGILKVTTTTGVLSTAVAGDFPTLNQNTSGTAATITGLLGSANIPKIDVLDASSNCADAGSTDAYACNLSPAATAYVTGIHYRFKANTANTGAATINFNSLGAKTIVKVAGGITTTLADNDIRVGQWVDLVYDGTNMQMQSLLGNAPAGSGTVTVVGAGSLTSTQIMTGGGSQTAQTPSSAATLDSSGNATFNSLALGGATNSCDGTAGCYGLGQGTAPSSQMTTGIMHYAPASVTSYKVVEPGAAATGYKLWTNSSNTVTETLVATIPANTGGTGQTSYTDGQLLIGNTATGGLAKATITAGTNITVTNGNGTITIASSGGGTGCTTTGTGVVTGDGSGGCTNNSGVTISSSVLNATKLTTGTPPSLTAGTGGVDAYTEGTVPSACAAATTDCVYADSTQHGLLASFNNGSYLPLTQGPASSTANHVPTFNSTNGGLFKDSGLTLTASTGTITLANGKTLTVNNTLTVTATDGITMTTPTTSFTAARTDAANTFTGTQTFAGALVAGTDNSAAGTIQLANASAAAHTIWGSGATTTNSINGFAAVPTTGHLLDCTVTSTTCLLHDSGVVTANVVNASSPGAGVAHFAGSTQTVTSSTIATGDIAANAVTSAKLAVVNTYGRCDITVGDTTGSVVTDAQLGPQKHICKIPAAATVLEIDIDADAGSPSVIVGRSRCTTFTSNTCSAETIVNLVSGALAASSGFEKCSNTGGTTGLDGGTTCSATLQNTGLNAGDWIQLVSGTAGGTAKLVVLHIIYTIS